MPVQHYKQVEQYGSGKPSTYLFIYLLIWMFFIQILVNQLLEDYTKIEFGDNQEYCSY